jgi:hypothetical protein
MDSGACCTPFSVPGIENNVAFLNESILILRQRITISAYTVIIDADLLQFIHIILIAAVKNYRDTVMGFYLIKIGLAVDKPFR